jgi:hypothetical protein
LSYLKYQPKQDNSTPVSQYVLEKIAEIRLLISGTGYTTIKEETKMLTIILFVVLLGLVIFALQQEGNL